MSVRLFGIIGIFALAYAALLFRLYDIQIVHNGYYVARAESEAVAALPKDDRGTIYFTDKNGTRLPAGTNKPLPVLYAVPKGIADARGAADLIAPILGESADALAARFAKPNDAYELLKRKADPAVAGQIGDLKIKGIYVDEVPERVYPFGTRAAQVLGFVGPNGADAGESGHYGIEERFDGTLRGTENITVTIDPNLEIEAERILQDLVAAHGAEGGTVIVEDPKTGKILAMGNVPSFDPNAYAASPVGNFLNPAVQHLYEPGSVFKVLTMAAGIDSGKITPETTYTDTGSVTLNGRTIQNYDFKTHGSYGKATMTNVIEHSINTGAVFAERQIGRDIFTAYVKRFGLDQKTGISLPGELHGDLRRLSPKEKDIAFATASYGQGVAVTPLELISAIAAIANGGNLMRPYLDLSAKPEVIRRVISESTARQVTDMMISAVDKAGVAKVKGFTIAGKTGTAFIPDFKRGGYTDKVIDSYVGFGPTSDPRFIILIKLNGLASSQLAALNVVPAFHDLAQFILNYYNIPPDRL